MLKRQGDILFERVGGEDRDLGRGRPVEDHVIAKGETTGHAHVLEGGTLTQIAGGVMVAEVPGGGRVVHEEHDTIELEPGVWMIHRQVEYSAPGETVDVYD